jgi:hypothetical protein
MNLSDALNELSEADAELTDAVKADSDNWGWAFNEMTDEQGEALNRYFTAVTKLLYAAGDPKSQSEHAKEQP